MISQNRIGANRPVVSLTACLRVLLLAGLAVEGCFPFCLAQSPRSKPEVCRWQVTPIESGPVFDETQFLDALHAYGSDGDCLWATEDGGRHWRKSYCVPSRPERRDKIQTLQFLTWTEGWLLVGFNQLLHTTDEGQTWLTQTFEKRIIFGLRFANPKRGWWVGEQSLSGVPDYRGVIYSTDDGGKTWDEAPTQINSVYRWNLIWVWPVSPTDIWVVGDLLLHSLDGGKTWRQPSAQLGELASLRNVKIQFKNPQVGWILRLPPDNYMVTKDGGKDWTPHRPPTKPAFMDDLLYLNAQDAWLAAGRLYHSIDGGISWKPSGPNPTHGEPRYNVLQYVANEHLLIATGDQGIAFCKLSPGIP
jgi:photosystem II stability/assembly factor-like uncharacterized protein